MSSWFSSFGQVTSDITASVQSAAAKVQSAASLVGVDDELIQKLTLTSPDLLSERHRIDEEERRKEAAKDTLAELLPWETRDEEREILVEECKESILALSTRTESFTTPFVLPGRKTSELAKKQDGSANDGEKEMPEGENKGDGGDNGKGDRAKSAEEVAADAALKAAEVEAKLAKLSPLPPLLEEFDLDTHVGLIQRLLKVDPNLVAMHANLSGAGEREVRFWKNYFFHCAYTRYETGLSVDEIWAVLPSSGMATPSLREGGAESSSNYGEETVTFDPSLSPNVRVTSQQASEARKTEALPVSAKVGSTTSSDLNAVGVPSFEAAAGTTDKNGDLMSGVLDFEVVSGSGGGNVEEDLDDLEAEIARELEE